MCTSDEDITRPINNGEWHTYIRKKFSLDSSETLSFETLP
jgi:hypothetical protein